MLLRPPAPPVGPPGPLSSTAPGAPGPHGRGRCPECPPALPGRLPSCGAAPRPSAMLGLCLFICFCLNSDLFHVWFENFQTQKSKKLGRIWCPCPQPTVLGAGSSVYHIPPCPGPGRLASCWGGGSQGDAARACDEGGAGGLAWPGWAGAGPPYCAADLGAGWVGGGHRRLLGSLQEEPGSSRGRFWNACGRVQ